MLLYMIASLLPFINYSNNKNKNIFLASQYYFFFLTHFMYS